jgi:hypothetical protein
MVNNKVSLTVAPVDAHENEIPMGSKELKEFVLTVTQNGKVIPETLTENTDTGYLVSSWTYTKSGAAEVEVKVKGQNVAC